MKDYRIIKKCLLCESDVENHFYFGDTPLANEYLNHINEQELFPLNLVKCTKCSHVQLDCIVSLERMFKHYLYVSGTSSVNVRHFKDYADQVIKEFNLNENNFIIDIGSNDGTFLQNFKDNNIQVLGIDPAENIADIANGNHIPTIPRFFNLESAKIIKDHYKKANVITCNNMFAHNDNLSEIVNSVNEILDDDGVFIFENTYLLDMYKNCIFDINYHEHIHQHSIKPLSLFFSKFNMRIFKVVHLDNHGGSIRVYVCKNFSKLKEDESVKIFLEQEKNIDMYFESFKNKFYEIKNNILNKLNDIKSQNKSIAVYGVPAKATTLFYAFNIDKSLIDFAVDDAKLKQGLFTPGNQIPIFHPDKIRINKPDYILILAWNFAQSIINNNAHYKGTWIIPLPELKEV